MSFVTPAQGRPCNDGSRWRRPCGATNGAAREIAPSQWHRVCPTQHWLRAPQGTRRASRYGLEALLEGTGALRAPQGFALRPPAPPPIPAPRPPTRPLPLPLPPPHSQSPPPPPSPP